MPHYEEPAPGTGPVGANIFRMRRALHLTQRQLASPEFSISYISAIERGRIRPSLKALDILARRLSVTPAELLAEPPNGSKLEDHSAPLEENADADSSILAMLRQRRAPYLAPIVLGMVSVLVVQRKYELASELLKLLSPAVINTEQHLLLLYFQGIIALEQGRPAEVQTTLEKALAQSEFSGHAQLLERCRFVLACAYEAQEKFLLASNTFALCTRSIEKGIILDPLFALQVYSRLAELYRRLGRGDAAVTWYEQTLSLFHFVFDPTALAEASAQISRQHLENVHSTLANWFSARTRVLLELAETRQRFTQSAINLGLTLQERGDPQAAEERLRQAVDFCEKLGTSRQAILTRIALADLLLERQEATEAERLALEAQALCRSSEQDAIADEPLYSRVLVTLGDANSAQGRLDEAERCFLEAIELFKNQDASEQLSHAYVRYGALLHEKGQDAESYQIMTLAYRLNQRKPGADG